MRSTTRRRVGARSALLAALLVLTAAAFGPADFARYHDYDALTRELRDLARGHDDLARLVSLGTTPGGRDIWAMQIAAPGALAPEARPALLIVGTLEGDQLVGSELALYTADYLLGHYATDDDVRARLESQTFYIVPRLNPDAAEGMFARVKAGSKLTATPRDADNDGRMDEDGPEDLNGDGEITLMRVPEAGGPYMLDLQDPRLVRKADASKGEEGGYALYWEGVDNDGDGFYNEDGPGGVDLNRNFQHAYPYYAPDAGPHMVSEAESRALMDFVVAHRNIAAVLAYGASDNLVGDITPRGDAPAASPLGMDGFADASWAEAREVGMFDTRPRGWGRFFRMPGQGRAAGDSGGGRPSGRGPATSVDAADQPYYRTIAERYREMTGIRTVPWTRQAAGAFADYAYYQFGVPAFTTPGWGLDQATTGEAGDEPGADAPDADAPGADRPTADRPAGRPAARAARRGGAAGPGAGRGNGTGADADGALLKWMDDAGVDGFVAWTPFDHPTLGRVEIGGFRPYAVSNPPADRLAALGDGQARFALYLASLLPRVRIADTDVEAAGGGIYRVTAEVENSGYLPTALAQGVTARAVAPTMVQLGIDPEALVTGDAKTSFFPTLDGSGARKTFTWVVRGEPGQKVELRVVAQKAGSDTATLTLR